MMLFLIIKVGCKIIKITRRSITLFTPKPFLLLLLFFCNPIFANKTIVSHSYEDAKAHYIIEMINHITWKDDAEIEHFTVGIVDDDSLLFESLKSKTKNITIRGKSIQVEKVSDISMPAATYMVLFFTKNHLSQLAKMERNFTKALFITDGEVKQAQQMIRFIYRPGAKFIDVRVNRENLINRGFKLSNELLLFAGSKFDLSEQLNDKEAYLNILAAKVQAQEQKISESTILLLNNSDKLTHAQQLLIEKRNELHSNQVLFEQVIKDKYTAQEELDKYKVDIAYQQQIIINKEDELLEQEHKLQQLHTDITNSEAHLKRVLFDLGKQSRIIVTKDQTISSQRLLLYLSIAITIIFIIIKYFLWKVISKRKQANKKLSILNDKLYHLATIDSMTLLYNRRHFLESALRVIAQQQRTKTTSAILMLDIDNFKAVNDKYGHAKGDEVIIRVAKVLKDILRDYDIVGRLGGEEFGMYLADCHTDKAMVIAERIRDKIENLIFYYNKDSFQVTISIGVSMVTNKENDLNVALKKADKALYQSKKSGRNKVSLFSKLTIAGK